MAAGQELTITYCAVLLGTWARQERLRSTKGFSCSCRRCLDPGERGTLMSGLVCTKCGLGLLLPHVTETVLAWRCRCGFQASTAKVSAFLARLEQEVVVLERGEGQVGDRVASLVNWMEKKRKMLPPCSDLLLRAEGLLSLLLVRYFFYCFPSFHISITRLVPASASAAPAARVQANVP